MIFLSVTWSFLLWMSDEIQMSYSMVTHVHGLQAAHWLTLCCFWTITKTVIRCIRDNTIKAHVHSRICQQTLFFFLQAPTPYVSETWRHLKLFLTKFDQTHCIPHFEHAGFNYQGGFSTKKPQNDIVFHAVPLESWAGSNDYHIVQVV